MKYPFSAIRDEQVPCCRVALLQHVLDTYASETNKVIAVWANFTDSDLDYRPHPSSSAVAEIMKHQLLSERRFFAEFLGVPEVAAEQVLPQRLSVEEFNKRMLELARPRLGFMVERDEEWWRTVVPFFDTRRERIWIFWRRVLHTAHHRKHLTVYLRLLGKPAPATYGQTVSLRWQGAVSTTTA